MDFPAIFFPVVISPKTSGCFKIREMFDCLILYTQTHTHTHCIQYLLLLVVQQNAVLFWILRFILSLKLWLFILIFFSSLRDNRRQCTRLFYSNNEWTNNAANDTWDYVDGRCWEKKQTRYIFYLVGNFRMRQKTSFEISFIYQFCLSAQKYKLYTQNTCSLVCNKPLYNGHRLWCILQCSSPYIKLKILYLCAVKNRNSLSISEWRRYSHIGIHLLVEAANENSGQ